MRLDAWGMLWASDDGCDDNAGDTDDPHYKFAFDVSPIVVSSRKRSISTSQEGFHWHHHNNNDNNTEYDKSSSSSPRTTTTHDEKRRSSPVPVSNLFQQFEEFKDNENNNNNNNHDYCCHIQSLNDIVRNIGGSDGTFVEDVDCFEVV